MELSSREKGIAFLLTNVTIEFTYFGFVSWRYSIYNNTPRMKIALEMFDHERRILSNDHYQYLMKRAQHKDQITKNNVIARPGGIGSHPDITTI